MLRIFLLVLLTVGIAEAQNYRVQKHFLGMEEGLSHRNTTHICQDHLGFIWIGSAYGLNRYDGKNIKIYNTQNHKLKDNYIKNLYTSTDNKLWIVYGKNGFWKDIEVMDLYSEELTEGNAFLQDSLKQQMQLLPAPPVFHNTYDGGLYFSVKNKIYEYVAHNQQFKLKIEFPQDYTFIRIIKGKNGHTWVLTETQEKNKVWYCYNNENKLQDQFLSPSKEVYPLRVSDKGALFFYAFFADEKTTKNYIKKIGSAIESFNYSLPQLHTPHQIYTEYHKQFWTSDEHNWYGIDSTGKLLFTFSLKDLEVLAIKDNYIDKQGGLWHRRLGAEVLHLTQNYFDNYLGGYSVRGIGADLYGNIYAATNNHGVFHFLKGNNTAIERIDEKDKDKMRMGALWEGDSVFWFSDQNDKVHCYSVNNKKIKTYYHRQLRPCIFSWAIFRSKSGKLWIGHNRGLSYLEEKGDSLSYLSLGEPLQNSDVYYIHENNSGLWLATSTGLYLMDNQRNTIIKRFCTECPSKLPHNVIAHLHESADGHFWLASKGGGLIHFNPQTGDYKAFTQENGLSHNILYAVYPDDLGNLWLSSDMGIMSFNLQSHLVQPYLPRDGVPHEEFNTTSHFKAADGTIYFGSINGFTAFQPKQVLQKQLFMDTEPPLVLVEYSKYNPEDGGRIDLTKHYYEHNPPIRIFSMDRDIRLSFALLSYFQSKYNRYAYQIEGYHADWIYTNNPTITLDGLPYGGFNLLVKAQTPKGQWIHYKPIKIESIRPFYYRTWFLVITAVVLFAVVIVIMRFREYELQLKKKKLEEMVEERTAQIAQDKEIIENQNTQLLQLNRTKDRFFAIVSHDLRGSVGAFRNLGELIEFYIEYNRLDMLKKLAKDVDNLSTHLSDLLNNLLQWAISQLGGIVLKPETFVVLYELNNIVELYTENAARKQISLKLNIPEDLSVHTDRNSLSLIMRNLVSNALKFTDKNGTVTISAYTQQNNIVFEVEDTGKGIPKDKLLKIFELGENKSTQGTAKEQGTGLGLVLCKEFAEKNGGNLEITSQEGKGTICRLLLPALLHQGTPAENQPSAAN